MTFQQYPFKGGIPSGNTAGRPGSPVIGDTYYNGQLEILEIYNGTQWVASSAPPAVPTVSSVTDVGTGLAYATGGTFTVVVAAGSGGATPLQYNIATTSGNFSATSSSTTLSLTGLTSNTSFEVVANAQNNFGTTVNSSPFAAVTATTVPQAPTIGTATPGSTSGTATVTWTLGNNGGKNLTSITITPFLNGTTAQTSRTAATTSSTSYTFTSGQLTAGANYTFKVKATNANGTGLDSSASNSVSVPQDITGVDYLIIAGGGGGGGQYGGGGGAGGHRSFTSQTVNSIISVVVGGGGAGGVPSGQGTSGSTSTLLANSASGGGGGGGNSTSAGLNGGSGGGASGTGGGGAFQGSGNAGSYSPSEGNNGGPSSASDPAYGSGGGGGAGAVGGSGTSSSSGNGGSGTANSITGTSVTRAAGGGAGAYASAGAIGYGGSGGGGNGGFIGTSLLATAGTTNTGSGGGGGGGTGGNGGSGVVIIKYADTFTATIGAGLTGTESSASGGFKRVTLTAGSGNVSLT